MAEIMEWSSGEELSSLTKMPSALRPVALSSVGGKPVPDTHLKILISPVKADE